MSVESKLNEIKTDILRGSEIYDSSDGIKASIFKSTSLSELMGIIQDNFVIVVSDNLITPALIAKHKVVFSSYQIFCNESTSVGHLLCVDSMVKVDGNTFVVAKGYSVVRARGRCKIIANGQSQIHAYEHTEVEAYGRTRVFAHDSCIVKATGTSAIQAYENSMIRAYGRSVVWASGDCCIDASGESYVTSFSEAKCSLSENAIYRIQSLDRKEIYASAEITIKQITTM